MTLQAAVAAIPRDVVVDGLDYPIVVASDAAAALPRLLPEDGAPLTIVYDRGIEQRAHAVAQACEAAGRSLRGMCGVRAGERFKRLSSVAWLYEQWLEQGCERSWIVVAIGGGTLTDVTGFAAATFLRGVRWSAVPTTILGMLDAAIGGKTGVDLPGGKNLAGAFWQPVAVAGDLAALATLRKKDRSTGLAEAVKCAIVADGDLLSSIERLVDSRVALRAPRKNGGADLEAWQHVIARCAAIKAEIVAADPLERGRRAALNLGHTVGHALEKVSKYRLAHGEAVSIGLRASGLIALAMGMWSQRDHARMLNALAGCRLPLHAHGLAAGDIIDALAHDKKTRSGRPQFVLPEALGAVRFGVEVPPETVRSAVEACLAPPQQSEWSN